MTIQSMATPGGARGVAAATTSGPTRSSGTFATLAEMSVALTTAGGDVLLGFDGGFELQSGDSFEIALFADGVEIVGSRRPMRYTSSQGALDPNPNVRLIGAITFLVIGVPAGAHTYTLQWAAIAGTARAVTTQRSMWAYEIPT